MATNCPGCGAAVEDGADLCLECGEPMGDSPAAKLARAENVIRPPANTFAPAKPASSAPPSAAPSGRAAPPPPSPTIPAKPAAKKKWAAEEPEPVRCPGCGVKSHAARCPNCGTKLKHDED